MLANGITLSLWLLLLLHISGTDSMKFSLFSESSRGAKEGEVRLAGSKTSSEGRVEIYHDGTWGTVCDDGWDLAEAQVVCRQLRFLGAKSAVNGGTYGEGSGPIWLDEVNCNGTESDLSTCVFKDWAVTDCTHKEDAGVVCKSSERFLLKDTDMNISDTGYMLDHSLALGDGCDFQIVVQSTTGNKQLDGTLETVQTTICAHKMILSRFPLFNTSEENTISVHVSLSCQPYFTSFIRYIYTRKADVTFSSAQCLHQMASKFGVKQLMEDTGRLFSKFLPQDVTFHTPVSLYEYSVETGDFLLKENCLQYMAWNYQNLTQSPAWSHLSVKLLGALLSRSDLVVSDEYFLLVSLEEWISQRGNLISLESQADLLKLIRFPMIPAEKLYELQFNSTLYNAHQDVYGSNILKAFQFNVLLFSTLKNNPVFKKDEDDYQARIYTATPWAATIDRSAVKQSSGSQSRRNYPAINYGYDYRYNYRYTTVSPYRHLRQKSFSTPVHNSLIFKTNVIQWEANIFMSQSDCSNRGVRCESFPTARLTAQNSLRQYQSSIRFSNQLLLRCQGKYICQVQDFKNDLSHISTNGSQGLPYPCPDGQYDYQFVVIPNYI
uniref:SRCR domain-containing protein n=1 Tax=Myripristis murdjan TaxID=586833 RepID=A0A668AP22_9TELE